MSGESAVLIAEILKASGLENLSDMNQADAAKLLSLIGEQRLKEAHVAALVAVAPHFIGLATEAIRTGATIAESMKESQKQALAAIQKQIECISAVLSQIAASMSTDACRVQVASLIVEMGKLHVEAIKEVNKHNNNTYLQIAGIATTIVSITVGVVYILSGKVPPKA